MRYAAKIDANQNEIVDGLRQMGASVHIVSQLKGFVDIIVGFRGHNYLFEIKDGAKPPSARKLTPKEQAFQLAWTGQVDTVINLQQALEVIMLKKI